MVHGIIGIIGDRIAAIGATTGVVITGVGTTITGVGTTITGTVPIIGIIVIIEPETGFAA